MKDPQDKVTEKQYSEVEKALERAENCRRQKDFQKGIDLLTACLSTGIERDRVYFRLGNICFDAGRLDEAEIAYRNAIEENSEHVKAHHNLSVVYKKKGKISEFVKTKKKSTKLAIKHALALRKPSRPARQPIDKPAR